MTSWDTLSKSELITELATVCRQLARLREQAQLATLKIELLEKVQRRDPA